MIVISLLDLWLMPRADHICSVLKPLIASFPGCVVCTIDSFSSLSGLCRIIVKIHLTLPEFEPQKVRWIDNNFVVIPTIFSYNADLRLRSFLRPLRGIRFNFACWYADKLPRHIPIIIKDGFWDLRSHEV